jgi:phage terminase small subunit
MTPKQTLFCDYYLISLNATEAAIKAGYSKKTADVIASQNMTKPDVKAYIDERLNKIDNENIADINEILVTLTMIIRNENEKTMVRLKALELLGKRYRLWNDDTLINPPIVNIINDIPRR